MPRRAPEATAAWPLDCDRRASLRPGRRGSRLCGFSRDERERLEQVLANLEQQFLRPGVARDGVGSGQIDDERPSRERVTPQTCCDTNAALDVQDFETAVVEKLSHTP